MSLEELIKIIQEQAFKGDIDRNIIADWLKENYSSDEGVPVGFDKVSEMSRMLDLIDAIEMENADKEGYESAKCLIYSVAVIDSGKNKIDIFKVREDMGISEIEKKYNN